MSVPYSSLLAETIRYPSSDGTQVDAYCARPLGVGPFPSVILLHHSPGLDEETQDVIRRLAARGYITVAPYLYSREMRDADQPDAAASIRASGGLPDARMLDDVEGALSWAHSLPFASPRAAVLGFCSGGRQAYLAACRLAFDAAIDCYGGSVVVDDPAKLRPAKPVAPVEFTESLSGPVLGIFGGQDPHVPLAHIEAVAARAKGAGKHFEYHVYEDAGHAFLGHYHASYRVGSANRAWAEIFAFLARHLIEGPTATQTTDSTE
jgi:carboxymethylenebutenolidase